MGCWMVELLKSKWSLCFYIIKKRFGSVNGQWVLSMQARRGAGDKDGGFARQTHEMHARKMLTRSEEL